MSFEVHSHPPLDPDGTQSSCCLPGRDIPDMTVNPHAPCGLRPLQLPDPCPCDNPYMREGSPPTYFLLLFQIRGSCQPGGSPYMSSLLHSGHLLQILSDPCTPLHSLHYGKRSSFPPLMEFPGMCAGQQDHLKSSLPCLHDSLHRLHDT